MQAAAEVKAVDQPQRAQAVREAGQDRPGLWAEPQAALEGLRVQLQPTARLYQAKAEAESSITPEAVPNMEVAAEADMRQRVDRTMADHLYSVAVVVPTVEA